MNTNPTEFQLSAISKFANFANLEMTTTDPSVFTVAIASALADVPETGGPLVLADYPTVHAHLCFVAETPVIEIEVSDVARTTSIYTSSASDDVEVRAYRPYTENERERMDDLNADIMNEISFTMSPNGDITDVETTKGSCTPEGLLRAIQCARNFVSDFDATPLVETINERGHWSAPIYLPPASDEIAARNAKILENACASAPENAHNVRHIAMEFVATSTDGKLRSERSRIAVTRNDDAITMRHIGGIAPYAIPELFGLIAHAAFGVGWQKQADQMNARRAHECAITSNTGMSGCQYLSLVVRKNDELRNYPTVAGFRVNSTGKIEGLKQIWLGDFAKLIGGVDMELTKPIEMSEARIIVPRTWNDIKRQSIA